MLNYTNPRKEVIIHDWPYGRGLKTRCHFYIEEAKGKQRACRVTQKPNTGINNAPKKLTYARKVLFVNGSDGKTYIMQSVGWAIIIMQSNMKYDEERISKDDPRFELLEQMFNQVGE